MQACKLSATEHVDTRETNSARPVQLNRLNSHSWNTFKWQNSSIPWQWRAATHGATAWSSVYKAQEPVCWFWQEKPRAPRRRWAPRPVDEVSSPIRPRPQKTLKFIAIAGHSSFEMIILCSLYWISQTVSDSVQYCSVTSSGKIGNHCLV